MSIQFPDGTFTVVTTEGHVLMRACHVCGAVVVEGENSDFAMHLRWHRLTGNRSWYDPALRDFRTAESGEAAPGATGV